VARAAKLCTQSHSEKVMWGHQMSIPVDSSWTLTFDEEFNGTSLNSDVWGSNWLGVPGTVTKPVNTLELAAYDPAQVSVSGGYLRLNAIEKPATVNGVTYNYRSGLVHTHDSFTQTYGYFEARIFLPGSNGQISNWPAFWLNGENWPYDGELDVMEGLEGSAAYHFHSPSGGPGSAVAGDFTGWHIFGALWEPGKVSYYYDNQLVGTITSGITGSPMYLILNLGIGVDSLLSVPGEMLVDWVHAYSLDPSAVAVAPQANYQGPGGTGSTPQVTTLIGTSAGEVLNGTPGVDHISGRGGNDTINGFDGNDLILSAGGADRLTGGRGADTQDGGEASDIYFIALAEDYAGDVITDTGTTGVDELRFTSGTASTLVLAPSLAGVERIAIGTGTAAAAVTTGTVALNVDACQVKYGLSISGNAGSNTLIATAFGDTLAGGAGNDVLRGRAGDDRLEGGLGKDKLIGGAGLDSFVFNTALSSKYNRDTIVDFNAADDTLVLENAIFTRLLSTGVLSADNFRASASGAAGDFNDYILYNTATGVLFYDPDGNGKGAAIAFAILPNLPGITAADFMIT
jgi:Ca2+-binding RTX toxin-like protein